MRFHFLAAALGRVFRKLLRLRRNCLHSRNPLAKSATGQNASRVRDYSILLRRKRLRRFFLRSWGHSPLEENLRRLTDEVGGRVTGSPQMVKAVEWGRRRLPARKA